GGGGLRAGRARGWARAHGGGGRRREGRGGAGGAGVAPGADPRAGGGVGRRPRAVGGERAGEGLSEDAGPHDERGRCGRGASVFRVDDRSAVEARDLPAQGELSRAVRRPPGLPDGYELVMVGSALVAVEAEALEVVVAALETAGTLYGYAASLRDPVRLRGRGVGCGIEAPGGRWVVRRYRRGGLVARWLGDRYLRVGLPRPIRELIASAAARRRGVATPRVIAAAVYPAGIFYRADVITEYIPDSIDLAEALFGPAALEGEDRVRA